MAKRFLTASPKELLSMTSAELLNAIRMSEGRILIVSSRVRCAPLIEGTTNGEVSAAFGADIILLDTYEPLNPFIPGLRSKNKQEDSSSRAVQVEKGKGYSIKEYREFIGRPVGILLTITSKENISGAVKAYGNIVATEENISKAVESGVDLLYLTGWAARAEKEEILKKARKITEGRCILMSGNVHGPGIIGQSGHKPGPEVLFPRDELKMMIDSGVDIINMPTPGTYPGFTLDRVAAIIDQIHAGGALASTGIHTSQEGSDVETIRRMALMAKMAGTDMHELGDGGFNESLINPQNIMAYSIVIRGVRHTYRRMAMSIKR